MTPPRCFPLRSCPSASDEHLPLALVLAADVDEDVLRLDPPRRDQAALEEPERDAQHDLAVLERPGLGLVGVDDEVVRARFCSGLGRSSTCARWGRTAPPRPRRLEALSSSMISSGVIPRARRAPRAPPPASYSARSVTAPPLVPAKTISQAGQA